MEFPMDTARIDEEVVVEGDCLTVYTDGDLVGCSVRLNNKQNDSIPLSKYGQIHGWYSRLFLTTSAQAGKRLLLFSWREASAVGVPGMATMEERILEAMRDAEERAWEALAGYKFIMFGYHASRWVNYRKLLGKAMPNPFREVVGLAQVFLNKNQRGVNT